MKNQHPVYQLFFASRNGKDNIVKCLLDTEFYFQHELIPAIVIATENANIKCMELLVNYCKKRFKMLPANLEPEINWALTLGSAKNPLLEVMWYKLIE